MSGVGRVRGCSLCRRSLLLPPRFAYPTPRWRCVPTQVRARGELSLAVLIETMRREGFELSVSPPTVLFKTRYEPALGEPALTPSVPAVEGVAPPARPPTRCHLAGWLLGCVPSPVVAPPPAAAFPVVPRHLGRPVVASSRAHERLAMAVSPQFSVQ